MRLSAAAEYRDEETGFHIHRMSLYAAAIARQLGLPEEQVRQIQEAAPMHDIGKIGIPDRILLKPGKLDDGEWVIMRQHPRIGAGILDHSDADVIRLGEIIARSHHEKWDGSGYPRGLKGEEIPLEGRIVAVADVFDALTSSRPYRKEPIAPLERVYAMMEEGRGKHFDPAVLDAFLAIPDTVREIMERTAHDELSWHGGGDCFRP
jgi:putative two-component system response regulator